MEARLLRASVEYSSADFCLVPEPRGAFSNLRPKHLPELHLGPEQIQLQPLVGEAHQISCMQAACSASCRSRTLP